MNQLEQFKTVHGVSWSSLVTGGISMESNSPHITAVCDFFASSTSICSCSHALTSNFLCGDYWSLHGWVFRLRI